MLQVPGHNINVTFWEQITTHFYFKSLSLSLSGGKQQLSINNMDINNQFMRIISASKYKT
jgi:hypothetical protein